MRHSQGPFGGEPPIETESRRLTPSIGLMRDDAPSDSSNEDFLFHLYRGSELLQDNRVHEAKEELERAIHLQPGDSKGQDLLAAVYFRLGLYPRAIQIYEQLRRQNANDTALLLNLALCYLKTGQPQLARRDLEQLLALNSTHARAWGYLGLACERLGDLAAAARAFEQGGHGQMAKRVAARRDEDPASGAVSEQAQNSREIRGATGEAYEDLDAGELSFGLAGATAERSAGDAAAQSWRPVEPRPTEDAARASSERPGDTRKPDTRDGPQLSTEEPMGGLAPSIPQLGIPQSLNRRPTLIAPVGAPPAHGTESEYLTVDRIPSHLPPSFSLDDAGTAPSIRRPVVAVPSPFGPAKTHEVRAGADARTGTLGPPVHAKALHSATGAEADGEDIAVAALETTGPGPNTPLGMGPHVASPTSARASSSRSGRGVQSSDATPSAYRPGSQELSSSSEVLQFPADAGLVLHPSGVALVRTTADVGFAMRLESIRVQRTGLEMQLLERHVKGKSNGESFGGVTSPMVLASGEGQLVLGSRPGRRLFAFAVDAEMCFVREDVLLGFGGGLAFENGRLATGEGEFIAVVQLRGIGGVLLESMGDVLTLGVRGDRSLCVRRDVVLGWFGRLVPRSLAPNDAPCGQRGLVSFAGDGRVLIAST
jgi:uncharacterized protein (AIM24 family)